MIAVLVTATQILIAGMAAARWLDPTITPRRLLGTAWLLGSGICAFILLALSLMGIVWTPMSFTLAFCVTVIALWVRCPANPTTALRAGCQPPTANRRSIAALAIDLCTLLLIVGHGAYALMVRGAEWDFWAIWGLKARVFLAHGGIDWSFLENPHHAYSHPDYPLLLPLNYVQVVLQQGEWSDRFLGLMTTFFGAALLLILRDLFEEELRRPLAAALATFAVASMAFATVGMADAPMIAFGTAALLTIRRGSLPLGSVLLGLAAFTKNEGLALMVAAAVALWAHRRSAAFRLWPAAAIAAPWLIIRAVHALPTDVVSGNLVGRALRSFARIPELARVLADHPPREPLFWIAIAAALVVYARQLQRERFVLVAVVLQLTFYLGVYLVTPYDIEWHVASSWLRLLQHVAIPFAFVALAFTAKAAVSSDADVARSAA